jgi:hypothetical protein
MRAISALILHTSTSVAVDFGIKNFTSFSPLLLTQAKGLSFPPVTRR